MPIEPEHTGAAKINWKTSAAGLLLLALAVTHAVLPRCVALDWPTVALVIAGVLLCFSREAVALLPYLKRLKLGEAEIELQEKLSDLRANVEQLEEEATKKEPGRRALKLEKIADTSMESTILDLATKDKAAALVRLAIEIEKEMARLCGRFGVQLEHATWRQQVDALRQKEVLDPTFARALIEFRDIRNQVIHSGLRGPVQESLITRALDNGIQLLRLLRATE